jgi:fatty acid desaturase
MRGLVVPATLRTILGIALDYAVIAAAIAAGSYSWWLYPLALIVIASRQHALLIVMHEASHRSLSRRLWLNDLLGNLLCAWPVLMDVGAFRHVHLQHHRFEGAAGDPDFVFRSGKEWQFPMSRGALLRLLLRDVCGLSVLGAVSQIRYYGQAPAEKRIWMVALKLAFYAAAAWLIYTKGWLAGVVLFWLVPTLTLLKAFIRVREIAEHYGLPAEHELNRTRTTRASWLERALISPRNIQYHLEHHMFPGVPWHSLPRLHGLLIANPVYAQEASRSASYTAALLECASADAASGEVSQALT